MILKEFNDCHEEMIKNIDIYLQCAKAVMDGESMIALETTAEIIGFSNKFKELAEEIKMSNKDEVITYSLNREGDKINKKKYDISKFAKVGVTGQGLILVYRNGKKIEAWEEHCLDQVDNYSDPENFFNDFIKDARFISPNDFSKMIGYGNNTGEIYLGEAADRL